LTVVAVVISAVNVIKVNSVFHFLRFGLFLALALTRLGLALTLATVSM
jgi:hypothetical protein